MTDLSTTIAPKSDQLNADDLIGGSITIKVTKVAGMTDPAQPIAIFFENDGGKPYKPGKSMRRVLVQVWGKEGNSYVGKSMTLYRDNEVVFGGIKVGGIRISHMSDISEAKTMALTASKASRKPFTVNPLRVSATPEATITKLDPQAPDLGQPVKAETEYPIYGGDGAIRRHVENANQWVDYFKTNLSKVDTLEKLEALKSKNIDMFGKLTSKGFGDQVGEVKNLFSERKDKINPPTNDEEF